MARLVGANVVIHIIALGRYFYYPDDVVPISVFKETCDDNSIRARAVNPYSLPYAWTHAATALRVMGNCEILWCSGFTSRLSNTLQMVRSSKRPASVT